MALPTIRIELIDPCVYLAYQRGSPRLESLSDTDFPEDADGILREHIIPQTSPNVLLPSSSQAHRHLASHSPHDTQRFISSDIHSPPWPTTGHSITRQATSVVNTAWIRPVMLRGMVTLSVRESVNIDQIVVTLTGLSETSFQARKTRDDSTTYKQVLLHNSHILLDSNASCQPEAELTTSSSKFSMNEMKSSPGGFSRRIGGDTEYQHADITTERSRSRIRSFQTLPRRLSHFSSAPALANALRNNSKTTTTPEDQHGTLAGVDIPARSSTFNPTSVLPGLDPGSRRQAHDTSRNNYRASYPTRWQPNSFTTSERRRPGSVSSILFPNTVSSPIVQDQVYNELLNQVVPLSGFPGGTSVSLEAGSACILPQEENVDQSSCDPVITESEIRSGLNSSAHPIESVQGNAGFDSSDYHPISMTKKVDLESQKLRPHRLSKKSWLNFSDLFKLRRPKPIRKHGAAVIDRCQDITFRNTPRPRNRISLGNQLSSHDMSPTDTHHISLSKPRPKSNIGPRLHKRLSAMIITSKPSLRSMKQVVAHAERPPMPWHWSSTSNHSESCPTYIEDVNFFLPQSQPRPKFESNRMSISNFVPKIKTADQKHENSPSIKLEPGEYHYPIVLPMPSNLPPSLDGRFGSVTYRLRADVIQDELIASDETVLEVIDPGVGPEVNAEELGNELASSNGGATVERLWENQLHYTVNFNTRKCLVGGRINIQVFLNPIGPVKVYRLSAVLLQKASYYSNRTRKCLLHTESCKFDLLHLGAHSTIYSPRSKTQEKSNRQEDIPLLPLASNVSNAFVDSPLFGYVSRRCQPESSNEKKNYGEEMDETDSSDEELIQDLSPSGPWNLNFNLKVPTCYSSKLKQGDHDIELDQDNFQSIHPSCTHQESPIVIKHYVKLVMRVEKGDDSSLDKKGKRKRYDIIIESPIRVLNCRCKPYELPSYSLEGSTEAEILTTPENGIAGRLKQCHCEEEYASIRRGSQLVARLSQFKKTNDAHQRSEVVGSLHRGDSNGDDTPSDESTDGRSSTPQSAEIQEIMGEISGIGPLDIPGASSSNPTRQISTTKEHQPTTSMRGSLLRSSLSSIFDH